jgi:glycosyltransferase involved in cell wall biosynthesis
MHNKVLFLTLRVFATGGIEKVCRVMGKALYELGLQNGGRVKIFSMYGAQDRADGNRYFPQLLFRGFGYKRIRFVLSSYREGRKSGIVLLSHINLLLVGYLIKRSRPSVKLVLLAHGIEVWQPLPAWKKRMLQRCDRILTVSHFTRDKMRSLYDLPEDKFRVLNNCLDPFAEQPLEKDRSLTLLKHYGLSSDNIILLTVSRMVETERYKGYDKVLQVLPGLIKTYPGLRYLLVGRYDDAEKKRLDELISILGLEDIVVFTGLIPDDMLAAHFKLGDVFVMPSEKEGFGIVFIEAMFYNIPVIAGNKDGSTDALLGGELGILIDPDNKIELINAISTIIDKKDEHLPDRKKLMSNFSYEAYKKKLEVALAFEV